MTDKNKWISVKDRLPTTDCEALVFSEKRIIHAFWEINSGEWLDYQNNWRLHEITHWIFLPEPPTNLPEVAK
jgi:hypothetical protein